MFAVCPCGVSYTQHNMCVKKKKKQYIYKNNSYTRVSVCVCVYFLISPFIVSFHCSSAAAAITMALYAYTYTFSLPLASTTHRYARRIEFSVNSVPFDCVVLTDFYILFYYIVHVRYILLSLLRCCRRSRDEPICNVYII